MARNGRQKPAETRDSFQNFEARLGIGTGNLADGNGYGLNPVTRDRQQIENMYRGSWLVGIAVDAVAEDMTRAGVEISSTSSPDDIAAIGEAMDGLALWSGICETIKWARLYGGAVGVILVEGQDVSTPLRPESVSRGQFRGILPLDRWMVEPSFNDRITQLGPDLGLPVRYSVSTNAPALCGQSVHHSRVIRVHGVDLPYWQRMNENGWGLSVIERLYDRLVAFDSSTAGAAQMMFRAHLRNLKIPGLRNIISMGGPAFEGLFKQIELIRRFQSNEGLTLLDGEDQFETHQYAFTGLSDLLLQFGQQVSGALEIPLVRLFGQSPAGLNATGDSDLRIYYDKILQQQERRLRRPMGVVLELLHRSVIGADKPRGFSFKFRPLWQMSEIDKSGIAGAITAAVIAAHESGIVDRATAMKEMRQSSEVTGVWSNISDEAIESAEGDAPPMSVLTETKPMEPGPDVDPHLVPDIQDARRGQAARP